MKDTSDSAAVGRAPEPDDFANRKLIRPALGRSEHTRADQIPERRERTERAGAFSKKAPPPEQTHAENFYYQKQMQGRTPMVFVLQDGEEVRGIIEWYDRNCIKVTRNGHSSLLIYKPCIKYMFKESENGRNRNG